MKKQVKKRTFWRLEVSISCHVVSMRIMYSQQATPLCDEWSRNEARLNKGLTIHYLPSDYYIDSVFH